MLELIVNPTSMDFIRKCDICDAFIIGEKDKGLRLAHYFTNNEILEIINLCKKRKQKIYIACNKMIHEEELDMFDEYIKQLSLLDIDGIIFGDLAIYQIAKKYKLENKLIYNPETYITNYESVRFFAGKGIKRVSIAKEITLEDIQLIASKQLLEIDILGHGPVNMFHSMRDLVTNYYKFLKSDQPEKHHNENLYLIEEIRDDKYPIIEDQNGTHVFSSFDLCTINYLDVLIENNLKSIRINGLFKTDDELYQITQLYKKAIEDYSIDKDKYMKQKDDYIKQLKEIENIRPFNDGFLFKKTIYKGDERNER
ncbi:U32 family peptidase [Mycoplasmatota bacterium]|nr:U32 family peptidase [Mycoplasmatota bacterium]